MFGLDDAHSLMNSNIIDMHYQTVVRRCLRCCSYYATTRKCGTICNGLSTSIRDKTHILPLRSCCRSTQQWTRTACRNGESPLRKSPLILEPISRIQTRASRGLWEYPSPFSCRGDLRCQGTVRWVFSSSKDLFCRYRSAGGWLEELGAFWP